MPDIPPQPPNPSNSPAQGDVSPIHTYKTDVAEFIKTEGKTLSDIAVAESQRGIKTLEENVKRNEQGRRSIYIIGAVFILAILSALLWWVTLRSPDATPTNTQGGEDQQKGNIFISAVQEQNIELDNLDSVQTIEKISDVLKQNSQFLVLRFNKMVGGNTAKVETDDFFEMIDVYPPGDTLRQLEPNFAVGSIGGSSRFLVLKTDYYGAAFAGMIKWEKTMEDDLRPLLQIPLPQTVSATGTIPIQKRYTFEDTIISNRDARVLKDGTGTPILLYLFPDNQTIIITSNVNTAKIVSDKLIKFSN